MTFVNYCFNHGLKIMMPNNHTHLHLFKPEGENSTISLLDFFSGYNITFDMDFGTGADNEVDPVGYSFSTNMGSTYLLESVRADQKILYSFEFDQTYLFVFYAGSQHLLHVSPNF